MSLYTDASLIMFPSGYKEDKIYSLKPTDGSGDLTFTRASTATRVNSDGLIETSPVNLLSYSEQFNNAYWYSEFGNTLTSNTTTAPNGTSTADTITATSGNEINLHNFDALAITANTYTLSQYLKSNGTNLIESYIFNISSGFVARGEINFANETFTTSIGTGSIENVGNGWYRISLSANLASGSITTGFFTTSTTGTRSAFVWGAQLNIGSTAKPYFPTTDRLNVPRIDYTGGGCGSLLLEKQSTNLILRSEEFDNAAWNKAGVSVTANNSVSPDGTTNADLITSTGVNGYIFPSNTNVFAAAAGSAFSYSVYLKAGTASTITILVSSTASYTAVFNLSTGVATTSTANTTASMSFVGNGWYRCIIVCSSVANAAYSELQIGRIASGLTFSAWGAQLEAGSYVSSYVPTLASSVTRLADVASKTGISSLIGQTEGVVFLDVIFPDVSTGQVFMELTGSGNDVNFQISGSTLYFYSATNWSISTIISANTRYKIAGAYKGNDIVFYVNGVQIGTDSSATISAKSNLYVNTLSTGAYLTPMQINQTIVFPTRLTNTQLASLTTI